MITEVFMAAQLNKRTEAYKHFRDALGGHKNYAIVRCKVAKHIACRQQNCAVKKSVKCHSVCKKSKKDPRSLAKQSYTPDCGEKGRELCRGPFFENGTLDEANSYGSLACRQIAMTV